MAQWSIIGDAFSGTRCVHFAGYVRSAVAVMPVIPSAFGIITRADAYSPSQSFRAHQERAD
jgi:hypothetical protein